MTFLTFLPSIHPCADLSQESLKLIIYYSVHTVFLSVMSAVWVWLYVFGL